MSFLKNAKIKTKVLTLILPLCLAGIGSVLAIAASYRQADTIHSEFIHNDGIASVELARLSTVIVIAGYSANQATLYAATDPEMKAVLEGYKTNSQRIATRFADLNRLMPSMSGELASFQKLASEILTVTDRIVKMGSEGQNESARVLLRTIDPMITQFRNEVRDTVDRMSERLRTETDNMTDTMTRTILTYLGALTVLFCGLIAAALFVSSRGITGPIDALRARMLTLAGGETDMPVPGLDRRDEVGQMADAVAVFRTNALDRIRLEDEASRNRSLSEEQQRREAEADRIRTANMSQATTGLGEGLKHLANGDLTFQLAKPFAPDFETLRTDFNAAVLQLAQTLRAVADATGAIDMGSREVSASADDLSKRTETQAASLEETAAALDQITVNVANSSKRADEARKVAVLANESAAQSGRVVADAGDAMNRIEQSSNEISNIIGVIDEIAFQTNLLALNAGVEAARAGEAGKGFAVVAQEVRELAQRSAKAAKEIKDLIRNSSIAVQSGVKLVSDTGESLKTIEGYIVTVNQHMDSIATSAREQSVGLAEVNTAVNQMDQVTQQNAAMVEETSAAGATLASESGRLRELIAQFQLGNALLQSAPGPAAVCAAQPAGSPARRLAAKVAYAVTGNAALKERWEDF